MALNPQRFMWHARAQLPALGWVGALGLALGVFALALQLTAVSTLNTELAELRREAQSLQARHQIALRQPDGMRQGPARQLDTFYEFFPAVGTLPHWLLKLDDAAAKHGIALDAGDYKLVQEKGRRLARYQITLPVKGSYDQIRSFMASVLNDIPAAALENIGLQREAIGSAALQASIKLTLFVRMENW